MNILLNVYYFDNVIQIFKVFYNVWEIKHILNYQLMKCLLKEIPGQLYLLKYEHVSMEYA